MQLSITSHHLVSSHPELVRFREWQQVGTSIRVIYDKQGRSKVLPLTAIPGLLPGIDAVRVGKAKVRFEGDPEALSTMRVKWLDQSGYTKGSPYVGRIFDSRYSNSPTIYWSVELREGGFEVYNPNEDKKIVFRIEEV